MNLVHLGAKFSPCMRHDKRIYAQIKLDRDLERETGCCIYNDGTGCFQTSYNTCPVNFIFIIINNSFLCFMLSQFYNFFIQFLSFFRGLLPLG